MPSVDVALLPHELRAARARMWLGIGGLVIVAGGIGAVWVLRGDASATDEGEASALATDSSPAQAPAGEDGWPIARYEPPGDKAAGAALLQEPGDDATDPAADEPDVVELPEAPEHEPADTEDPAATATGEATERVVRFGQARGFRDALRKTGGSPEESDAIITALTDLVDFRRCRPEHELVWERDADGTLTGFEYRVSTTERYRATPGKDGKLAGAEVEVPIERRRVAKGGHVAGSLGHALEHLGLGRSLVGVFVEVFERHVSFKKDTRAGDSFRIIVDEEFAEGERLGYGNVHAVEYVGERAGKLRAFWFEPRGGRGDYFDERGRAMNGGWLRTPLRYDHISSPFNPRRRHPVLKRIMPHNGVDYAAASGTPVWAAADGKIIFAGNKGANGNLVGISHAGGYETYYAHLSRISRGIKRGVKVTQRTPIGAVGTTGRSTGPHLHFGLKRKGRFVDPMTQLNGPGKPLPAREMPRFKQLRKKLETELARIQLSAAPSSAPEPEEEQTEEFHEDPSLDL